MKVCHITTVHKPNDNRIFYKECITLKESGYDVSLIVAGVDNHVSHGITIYGFPRAKNRFFRITKTSFLDAYNMAKMVNADIYHFHDPELMFVGLLLKMKGKKVIFDIHENTPAAILSKPYLKSFIIRKIVSVMFHGCEKMFVKAFDAIITARPDISDRFLKDNPITLRNFPILPDYNTIIPVNINTDKKVVIYVGGMTEIRGIRELIEAFEHIKNAELWLLGEFSSKSFENECKKLKGWENTRILGSVEPYEIFSYIKRADIGIITFLPEPNHITTLATKPFEYMACGLPMVMSDFDYWKQFFKESSLYVKPSNSLDIAEKVKLLLEDEKNRKEMSKLNFNLSVNEYNWDKEKIKLIDLYKKLSA